MTTTAVAASQEESYAQETEQFVEVGKAVTCAGRAAAGGHEKNYDFGAIFEAACGGLKIVGKGFSVKGEIRLSTGLVLNINRKYEFTATSKDCGEIYKSRSVRFTATEIDGAAPDETAPNDWEWTFHHHVDSKDRSKTSHSIELSDGRALYFLDERGPMWVDDTDIRVTGFDLSIRRFEGAAYRWPSDAERAVACAARMRARGVDIENAEFTYIG